MVDSRQWDKTIQEVFFSFGIVVELRLQPSSNQDRQYKQFREEFLSIATSKIYPSFVKHFFPSKIRVMRFLTKRVTLFVEKSLSVLHGFVSRGRMASTNKAQAPSALWLRYLFCLRGKVKVALYRVSRAVLLKTYQSLRYKSCETVHCTCKRQQYTSG